MKNGWRSLTIGQIGRVFNGNSISESEKKTHYQELEQGVPYIGTKDVRFDHEIEYETGVKIPDGKQSRFKIAPADSVLVCAEGGSAGRKIACTNKDVYFGNKLFAICPAPPNSSRFVFYYCLSDDFGKQFRGAMAGLIGGVSINKFKDFRIALPAPPEQKRIVGILDEAFDSIAKAKANIERNINNERALFESYLQSMFECNGERVRLSELAADITDGDHSPPPKASSGVPFITISDIVKRTRTIDFSQTFSVPREYFQNLKPNKKPRPGDVLYTVTGATLGIPVLVTKERDFCFQRHIGLIRPKSDTDSVWLSYALLSPQVFRQATIGSTGTAQKTVSLAVLRSITVPRVKLSEQRAIGTTLEALMADNQRLESIYERKLTALDALKKAILHQAFTGAL